MTMAGARELLKCRVDATLRRAIKLRAALLDVDLQDVMVAVLREGLRDEIHEVRQRGLVDGCGVETKKRRGLH